MNELKVMNQNTAVVGIEKLTIFELLQGMKVADASDMELDIAITAAIEKANLDLGRLHVDDADHNHLCNSLIIEARTCFSTLTLLELQAYVANGVRNKYSKEPVYKPTVILVTSWWNAGLQAAERIEKRKEMNKEKAGPETEPSAEKKFNTAKDLSIKLFDGFKVTAQFNISVLAVYEFLKSLDLIDIDYRKGIYIQSVEETIKLKQIEVTLSTDLFKRRRLNAELEMFTENYANDGLTKDQHEEVLRTGRKIALRNWLNDLIVAEDDFESLIESKRP